MKHLIKRHKSMWSQKAFLWSAILGLLLLSMSMVANYYANVFITSHADRAVSDIILDNIPVVNVDFIFVDGAFLLWIFVMILLVRDPKKIPFTVKSVALFVFIRSIFVILTYTGLPLSHSFLDPASIFRFVTSGNDMFFSSHTGLPFLMALIFWSNEKLRIFFIFAAVFFGASVLLGHLHYSIDVFAAFFITYSIFIIAQKAFPRDFCLASAPASE